ncbi:Peptide transporter family 1 [Seminavis robusta]|uniref:Peptide transporter family 1 n=1 Tax=Seminavis robusta TaxID=568900 RepID=A0A9N8D8R7_9STRA|nr:Peptide transporter family 1 [Seminavis robusta]|eukprot:Sro3_g002800.1 Peptide transporter family 1 (689) ;mRNA; r:245400-247466
MTTRAHSISSTRSADSSDYSDAFETSARSISSVAPTPHVTNQKRHTQQVMRHSSITSSSQGVSSSFLDTGSTEEDVLPSNVNSMEQLEDLPPECLSNDPHRPLRHVDDQHHVFTYSLNPTTYSVALILVVELLERFSFYGIYYTQTLYLTGVYNPDWNPGLNSVAAASFVSTSTAVAYTTPFIGAILADALLGDYWSILAGSIGLYLPGILLVALTSVPYFLGDTFNKPALFTALLFLWPMGTGIIKSVVNVFGAKQFHPILQSNLIEQYYVNFYISINVGALVGITLVPILAQHNVTTAYLLPVSFLALGILIFVSGTPRYVIGKPRGDLHVLNSCTKRTDSKNSKTDPNAPPTIPLSSILRITLLIVPFCIAYSQMPTTFIVQGTVMRKAFGFIDAATMNALDALSVLVFGWITGNVIYPGLAQRGIKLATTTKFAIGSALGALAIAWSLLVEHWIHAAYHHHQNQNDDASVSILWQAPAYMLIGAGEIFAVSAAYEVAFTASAPTTKALASAVNIFCVGGIPNIICIGLYQACEGWAFRSQRGDTNLQHLEDYATAHVGRYFAVLLGILLFGVALNLYPPVRDFVDGTEQQAADLVKTPVLRKPNIVGREANGAATANEQSPLLSKDKAALLQHQNYLKYGKGPVLYKLGSMRAGPSLSHKESKNNAVKKSFIPQLYGGPNEDNV